MGIWSRTRRSVFHLRIPLVAQIFLPLRSRTVLVEPVLYTPRAPYQVPKMASLLRPRSTGTAMVQQVSLTVAQQALFVTLGTGNVDPDPIKYTICVAVLCLRH